MGSTALVNLAFLALAVVVCVIGLVILWLARRRPKSMEAGMRAFHRELEAMAPPDAQATRAETHVDHVTPAPIRRRPARHAASPRSAAQPAVPARPGEPHERAPTQGAPTGE